MKTFTAISREFFRLLSLFFLAFTLSAQDTATIVSAASYTPGVTPDSLASAFGIGLSEETASAQFDENGQLPLQLAGVSVKVGDIPAPLLFVSPGQVNFLIPANAPLGSVPVTIQGPSGTATGTVAIAAVSPGVFMVDALRQDRGALADGSTWTYEPFSGITILETSEVVDTRISLFGTGWRNADGNVQVYAVGPWNGKRPMPVEYAGIAPGFVGLDQINVRLPEEVREIGILTLIAVAGGRESNAITIVMNSAMDWKGSLPVLHERPRSAGNGETKLVQPADVAWANDGGVYIADPAARSVFYLSASGALTRFAGTGTEGNTGDGGPAAEATLTEPIAVDVDSDGNVYIVDRGANRVRVVGADRVIRAFAGNGTAGYGGDGGPAVDASFNGPSDLVITNAGSILIADTLNQRIRVVTSDGKVQNFAGSGEVGDGNVWGDATCAALSGPTSMALGVDGAVFVVDSGSSKIHRILPNGQITTVGGVAGGEACEYCSIADFPMAPESRTATDAAGRIYVSHPQQGRVYVIESTGVVHHIAGNSSGSDTGGPALQTRIQRPLGLSVRTDGTLLVADFDAGKIRQFSTDSGESCSTVKSILFEKGFAVTGESVHATVQLACPVSESLTVHFDSSSDALLLPENVSVPVGSDTGYFTVAVGELSTLVSATIHNTNSPADVLGRILLLPKADTTLVDLTLQRKAIPAGLGTFATLRLGAPAPTGGLSVNLSAPGLLLENTVQVPAGDTVATFAIHSDSSHSGGTVQVSASVGGETIATELRIVPAVECPNCGCVEDLNPAKGTIGSLTITPETVTTETSGQGVIQLQQPAGPNGVVIVISSTHPGVQVPLTVIVPPGETTASFPVTFLPVTDPATVTVTATSGNSVSTTVTLSPPEPVRVNLLSFTVQPDSVEGGANATGTVTLAVAAPANGALVEFSSSHEVAHVVQERLVIPAGANTGTVTITTTQVSSAVTATLTATSQNSTTATLAITIGAAGQGQIGNIHIDPNPISSGTNGIGTVTLAAPAGPGGVQVSLSSSLPSVTVPSSVIVAAGETTAIFVVTTSAVSEPQTATIAAVSANTVSTQLSLLPPGPGQGEIGTLSVTPNPAVSGTTANGTVTLLEDAGPGGALVTLSSNNPNAVVPASVVIPAGSRQGTFVVTTSAVAETQTATITATSANQLTAALTLQPPAASSGTIASLTINPSQVTSGQQATGTVTITSAAPEGGVLVNLSSNIGSATVPATLIIPAGQTSATFPVNTTPVEENQTAVITAVSANTVTANLDLQSPGASKATLGAVGIQPNPVTSGESAEGTVTLAAPAPQNGVLVTLTSSNPNVSVPLSLVVPAGQMSATFPVSTTRVGAEETAQIVATSSNAVSTTLTLNAALPTLGSLGNLTASPNPVKSGNPSIATVTLASPAPVGGVQVNLTSTNPNAIVPPSIVIPAGQTQGTFTITTTPVATSQTATIAATSANSVTAVLGLNPPDPTTGNIGSVNISPNPVVSGNGATGTVTLSNASPAGGVLVNLSSNNANAVVPASVVVPAGQNTVTFPVSTSPVASNQTATITAVSSNSFSTVLNLDAPGAGQGTLQGVTITPNPVVSGNAATGMVTLPSPAPAGGILVTLSSNNPVASVPPSIIIPAGQTSGTFPVTTTASGNQETAVVTATSANSVTGTLTLNPPSAGLGTISGVSVTPNPVKSGSGATGTVTLAANAPVGGILVNLTSNNANATVPATVTIPAGQSSATFAVATTAVASTQTAQITATSANSSMVLLTLNPPDPGTGTISGLSLSPNPVTSGESSTGTVTLGAPAAAGGVQVTLSSNNANATIPASIVIPAGSTTGTFAVATSAVGTQQSAVITATSANSSTATLTLNAANPETGTLTGFTITPSLVKGGASATGIVSIGSAAGELGVIVNLASNNAHAVVPPSVTIPAGQSSRSFTIQTTSVTSLQNATITATSANSRQANLQIDVANPCVESLNLNVSLTNVLTGQGLLDALVTLSGPAPVGGSTINLVGVNGNLGQVFVPQGQTQASVQISVANLLTIVGSTLRAVLGDCPGIEALISLDIPLLGNLTVPASIHVGNNGNGLVSLLEPAPAGGVEVALSVNADTALGNLLNTIIGIAVPSKVVIPEGQLSASFQVQTSILNQIAYALLGDLLGNLNISAELGVSLNRSVALTKNPANPNAGTIATFTINPGTVKGGVSATGIITLASAAGPSGVLIALSSNQSSAVVPASITIAAGQTQGTFTITTSAVNALRTATIVAQSSNTVSRTLQVDVVDPCVQALNLNVSLTNILTGAGLLDATVTLTGPAPVGGSTINLLNGNVQLGQILVPQGQTQGTVQLAINNLFVIVGSTLRAVLGSCGEVGVTISLDVPILGSLHVPATVKLGTTGVGTVTLLEPAPAGGAVVTLSKSSQGLIAQLLQAAIGVTVPDQVVVPAGATTATFNVQASILNSLLYGTLTALAGDLLGPLNIHAELGQILTGVINLTK